MSLDAATAGRRVGVIFPTGMLGAGFTPEALKRGVELGATAITIDGGSTDSGPHYLGTGTAKTADEAVERDLRLLLVAAQEAQIPLVVSSCGTGGTDRGVDWVAGILAKVAAEEQLTPRVAKIYSELSVDSVVTAVEAGRVKPLAPSSELTVATVRSCEHIVGLMGHEPIVAALRAGADVVLAGRATDTSLVASIALMHGLPAGPAWHAAKVAECGGQCTVDPRRGGVYVEVDDGGFTIEPLDRDNACTPTSVAAHLLYENADPFRMREPTGFLDTSSATYTALDDRRVRVEGSLFDAAQHTIKVEGSAVAGYETLSLVGIRDPEVLDQIDVWVESLQGYLVDRVRAVLGLEPETDYQFQVRCYGHNALLGDLEPDTGPPKEVGVLLNVRAPGQATATAISKIANPGLLHMPIPGMSDLPSFAFLTSPAHVERGAAYEFVLNHVIEVGSATDLFRTIVEEPTHV